MPSVSPRLDGKTLLAQCSHCCGPRAPAAEQKDWTCRSQGL